MERLEKVLDLLKQERCKRYHDLDAWLKTARPSQLLPKGEWSIWLILAGRGFGKTKTGAESLRLLMEKYGYRRAALIGASQVQTRSIMVEGVSGIQSCYTNPLRAPKMRGSTRELVFQNGAVAQCFGGDQVDQLRGPQFDLAWIDEFAKFRRPEALLEQLSFSLRLGKSPKCIITTTPRPLKILEELMKREDVVVTKGSTFENKANLAPSFLTQVARQFQHTKLGAQELYGEILSEQEGALWQRSMIHYKQPLYDDAGAPQLRRIVVAIDPATTHHDKSDETGVMVVGIDDQGDAYVLEDLSGRHSPLSWGQRAVDAYHRYRADRIVAETNKGGDLVERVIRSLDASAAYKEVRATKGKATRAEPVAALYERGRVFHARPLTKLEEQMCSYVPGLTSKSPDRIDALVWGITELMLTSEAKAELKIWGV